MTVPNIPLRKAFGYWLKLGFLSFGGPTGQISMMHKDLVDNKEWIDEEHFLQALNFCMLLPGPEAQQLATYIGWLRNGTWGGIIAGGLFVLPSIFILWGLAYLYASQGTVPSVAALLYGLKPAVVAIVFEAVLRIARKSLKTPFLYSLAGAAFIGIYFLNIPFPVIVLSAGLIGYVTGVVAPGLLPAAQGVGSVPTQSPIGMASVPNSGQGLRKGLVRSLKVLTASLILWFLPIVVLGLWRGWRDTFVDIGILFSKAALVTFGGAYAVLAYIGQEAVNHYHWIMPEQMMDGLGLAETTPGPLIMVNQFVGYLAGYYHASGLSSAALGGAIGGFLATWVTFIPSFLMIFLLAPYIETLRRKKALGSALGAITAAVVGVVLNLAVLFTYHTLVPDTGGFDWYALATATFFLIGMQRFKWGMIPVIIGSAAAGFGWKMIVQR